MNDGNFERVGESADRMYGARKILACGYRANEQDELVSLLETTALHDVAVIFVTNHDKEKTLKDIMESEDRAGMGKDDEMRRAIVMSGFTKKELHQLMTAYRRSSLPGPLWATLTPTSESWPIGFLLDELAAEAEAFRRGKR